MYMIINKSIQLLVLVYTRQQLFLQWAKAREFWH